MSRNTKVVNAPFERSRVSRCSKDIVRFVHSGGYAEGDQLPPQQELRITLGASNDTVTAAMARLVKMGLLTRKNKIGTVVADFEAATKMNWSFGIGTFVAADHGPSAFFSNLHYRCLIALSRMNCRCSTYFRVDRPTWPEHRLREYVGLEEDVLVEHLDGLLMLSPLDGRDWHGVEKGGVPVCIVGTYRDTRSGVLIDTDSFVTDAIAALRERGCKSVELVDSSRGPEFTKSAKKLGYSSISIIKPGFDAGPNFVRELLSRPESKRPDGFAVTDDYVAMELSEGLHGAGSYRPQLAVMTNIQMPIAFSLPVVRFGLDLDELVDKAVRLLYTRTTGCRPARLVESVSPRLVTER